MKRPNIVLIMADQMPAASVGCYGSPVGSTPTLDRMAAQGTVFERSYCSVASCAPNRASMLTGRSPEVHGVTTNNLELQPDDPTYAQLLRGHGYRTGGFGKFHVTDMLYALEPDDFSYLGFDESAVTGDVKAGCWLDWVREKYPEHYETALAVTWPVPCLEDYGARIGEPDIVDKWKRAYDNIMVPRLDESGWEAMYVSPLPAEVHQTTYITDVGLDFMRRHLENEPDRPFFCKLSYVDPHDPYDPPAPYATMFDPADMPDALPPNEYTATNPVLERGSRFHRFQELACSEAGVRKLRALYHGSVRFIDDQIARVVDFLEEKGVKGDTIVVFVTDHGDMLGDHGMITKGVKHFDRGIRVPHIVWGGGITSGRRDELVCALDFFPTFMDWAGITDRPALEGRSFAPLCRGEPSPDPWPEIVVQSAGDGEGLAVWSLITDDQRRFTLYENAPFGELYHLDEDPEEAFNHYDDPAHTAERLQLSERLIRARMRGAHLQRVRNFPVVNGERQPAGLFAQLDDSWLNHPVDPSRW